MTLPKSAGTVGMMPKYDSEQAYELDKKLLRKPGGNDNGERKINNDKRVG